MSLRTTDSLLDQIRRYGLLPTQHLDELDSIEAHFAEPQALSAELQRRNLLTVYQMEQILAGNAGNLKLGSYVLLERLGAGGMGQVFKARHQLMNRLVALKLIRPELLSSTGAARRFQQEIHAVAHLAHPHIIAAYDAEQVEDKLFLVMEYANGLNLRQFVTQSGPLAVELACAIVKQTSLGLQHAFERGILHRDIKPENILVTEGGIKILDLGLARLSASPTEPGSLTGEGAILGTPDYIAPEQANDPGSADIRADLYSLGCTFYFALTGQVPFPGGTMLEKLLRHRMEALREIQQRTPASVAELSNAVASVRVGSGGPEGETR